MDEFHITKDLFTESLLKIARGASIFDVCQEVGIHKDFIQDKIAENSCAEPLPDHDYSQSFAIVLSNLGISLAVTTYDVGKLCLISSDGKKLKIIARQYRKPMGCYFSKDKLLLATQTEVHIFRNAPCLLSKYHPEKGYDSLYIPQVSYSTGDIGAHDVVFIRNEPVVVSSRFSSVVKMSNNYNFNAIWKPPFISKTTPEDKCHLNGIALLDNELQFATALCETDRKAGWRDGVLSSGVIIDVNSGHLICKSLCIPHSPRVYEESLWLLASGVGEFGIVSNSRFIALKSFPGFLRGLAFHGSYVFIGLSRLRHKSVFGSLPLEERFDDLRCSIEIMNIKTGRWEGSLEFFGNIKELYDIQIIQNSRNPMVVDYGSDSDAQALFCLA